MSFFYAEIFELVFGNRRGVITSASFGTGFFLGAKRFFGNLNHIPNRYHKDNGNKNILDDGVKHAANLGELF